MIRLSPKDSSILTRITRYRAIPLQERQEILNDASEKAKEIGAIILGTSTGESADTDTKAAARAYQVSFKRTSRGGRRRSR